MFGPILQRMILLELLKVFILSLLGLTGLFLLAGLIQEASQRGLAPAQILAVIPLLVPNTLPYTIPATTLFATCVVYGRLAHDNEITAIKAAGINVLTIIKPALVLGIATSAVTGSLYYHVIPYTHQLFQAQFLSNSEEVIYNLLKRNRNLRLPNLPYVMYVKEVKGKRLIDVIFKRRKKVGELYVGYDMIARAREATLRFDLENNRLQVDMDRCVVIGDKIYEGHFLHRSFTIDLPSELTGKELKLRAGDLTWEELEETLDKAEEQREEYRQQLFASQQEATTAPPAKQAELQLHQFHLNNKLKFCEREILSYLAEQQMRPAMALGCLCFVLVGCPVGIWASRSDYLSSFVICFLPTIFLYYPLMLCGSGLAREGKAPVVPAIWAADLVMFITSLLLIRFLVRK